MSLLDPDDLEQLLPAETASFASPIPTQFVSSDEFSPLPQTARQKQVEARVKELGGAFAKHQGMSRRRFFQTAAGMAAAFVAMNEVYGAIFDASRAEAATPDMANERARALADEFIIYEKLVKAGLVNVCVHKGLYPISTTQRFPSLVAYADVSDVGKAAKDWPQLNFVIYHSAFRFVGGEWATGWTQFEQTGRVDWVTDLAEIPAKYGVTNVYGDLGQIFAQSTVAEPRLCAAMMGTLVKGLGWDHVVWGTDAVWTGSPQWQIEALRRLEIPGEMQKKYGFAPLGPADGRVKRAIFGENSARLYKYTRRAELASDRIALGRDGYEREGPGRTNRRYGFVAQRAG